MPKEFGRPLRIADQIRRELGSLVTRDVADPRLGGIVVSGVEVSRDLAHAKVFVTLREGAEVEATLRVLRKATGYLRRKLAHRLRIRIMPRLEFVHDPTLDTANRIDLLLAGVGADDDPADAEADAARFDAGDG